MRPYPIHAGIVRGQDNNRCLMMLPNRKKVYNLLSVTGITAHYDESVRIESGYWHRTYR